MLDFFKTVSAFVFAGIAVRHDGFPPRDTKATPAPVSDGSTKSVRPMPAPPAVKVTIPDERLTSEAAMQRLVKAASAYMPVAERISTLNRAAHDEFHDAEAMLAEIQRDLAVLMGEAPPPAALPVAAPVAVTPALARKLAA